MGHVELAVVADDLTGATDIASSIALAGVRVAVVVGAHPIEELDVTAVVYALKIRSEDAQTATTISLHAAEEARRAGADQVFFKYSSTFDSGERGNIGPVADSLADLLGQGITIVTPAFPRLGRTVVDGILYVNGVALADARLGDHPLTPRRESSVVLLMARQTERPVGLIELATVREGASAITASLFSLRKRGFRYAVVDAMEDSDLVELARVVAREGFVTGASGLGWAIGLGLTRSKSASTTWAPPGDGHPVLLCGSCSIPTQRQVTHYTAMGPTYSVNERDLDAGGVDRAAQWVLEHREQASPLVYSTPIGEGRELDSASSLKFEAFFATLARVLQDRGVNRFVVAGGETSGAVIGGLDARSFRVGPEVCPGVPWLAGAGCVLIALKSGNFGADDFFERAAHP